MRTAAFVFGALFFAASAFAQEEPKVWTDADLAKPLPRLHRTADPEVVAAMKRRADYIPLMGSRSAAAAVRAEMAALPARAAAPAPLPAQRSYYPPPVYPFGLGAFWPAQEGQLYASQPLYPFVTVVYSNRPARPLRQPCPVPPVFLSGRR